MIDSLKQKVKNYITNFKEQRAVKKVEQHRIRQLFIYMGDYNNRSTMWQTNFMGDRVRNKHKMF